MSGATIITTQDLVCRFARRFDVGPHIAGGAVRDVSRRLFDKHPDDLSNKEARALSVHIDRGDFKPDDGLTLTGGDEAPTAPDPQPEARADPAGRPGEFVRRCAHCRGFMYHPRANRRFCSARCRKAASRGKRDAKRDTSGGGGGEGGRMFVLRVRPVNGGDLLNPRAFAVELPPDLAETARTRGLPVAVLTGGAA